MPSSLVLLHLVYEHAMLINFIILLLLFSAYNVYTIYYARIKIELNNLL